MVKKRISLFAFFSLAMCCFAKANILLINNSHREITNSAVPVECLNIINDTLFGFKDKYSISDLSQYDTLEIPANVKKIAPMSFIDLFAGNILNIKTLVFNEGLEEIGDAAFKGCSNITSSIDLPNSIKKIGSEAFCNCWISGSLIFPDGLTSIGDGAFKGCSYLNNSIVFPNSLTKVGNLCFQDCYSVKTLDFSHYESIPDWLYSGNWIFFNFGLSAPNKIVYYPNKIDVEQNWKSVLENRQYLEKFDYVPNKSTEVDCFTYADRAQTKVTGWNISKQLSDYDCLLFPSSVTTIEKDAFKGVIDASTCHVTLKLNEGVTTIGESAFENCTGLTGEPVFPSSLTKIEQNAFKGCSGFDGTIDLTVTQNLTLIGKNAFDGCSNFICLKLPVFKTSENEDEKGILEKAFLGCSSLCHIDVSAWDKDSIPEVSLTDTFKDVSPSGIVEAHEDQDITQIKNLFSSTGVDFTTQKEGLNCWIVQKSITNPTLLGLDELITMQQKIVYGVTDEAQQSISEFDGLKLPDKVTTIAEGAFNNLFRTEKDYFHLILNLGLKNIEKEAFLDCPYIVDILNMPHTITEIGDASFKGCKSLRGKLVLPQAAKIGENAFDGCILLSNNNLIFPNSLLSLGTNAFSKTSIKKITVNKELVNISPFAFSGINNLSIIDLSNFDKIPVANNFDNLSFALSNNEGQIIIKHGSGSIKQWSLFLRELGLPNGWVIKEAQ